MLFQNLENLYLIATIFISHRLIKSYPSLLFPLTNIPFVRLVEAKKDETTKEKKKRKKLEKGLNQGQKVISYEKGILFGSLENMMDINYLVDLMQFQYMILIALGMMAMKITSFILYHFFGLGSKYTENFLVQNNLLNIILTASIVFICYKLVKYKLGYKGIKSSDSISSFIITSGFSIFIGLVIYSLSHHLTISVKPAIHVFNTNLQFLLSVISLHPKKQYFIQISQDHFNSVLLVCSIFTSWILASPVLKFGKIYNIVNTAIRDDEERMETLEGERELNKENIEKLNEILKGNKKRLRILLLSLTLDIIILLLFIKPLIKDFFSDEYIKNYHGLMTFLIAIASLGFKLYTSKAELQIKYTSLFQKLINFKPKDEVYHEIYKQQIDFIYKESLKDSFLIFSKVILPLFVLLLGLSLEFKQISYEGNKSRINKKLFRNGILEESLVSKVLVGGNEIFGQLGQNGVCPLNIEENLVDVENGFGVLRGFDLNSKLKTGDFGRFLTLLGLSSNMLMIQFMRFFVLLTYFFEFFGSVFYIFYVMKTEEYY